MGIHERKKRERAQRRDGIISAAKRVFLEKGIENSTMQNIAREAELSKAALYLYFRNKEELTFEILRQTLNEIHHRILEAAQEGRTGFEKVQNIGRAYLDFYSNQTDLVYFSLILDQYAYAIANGKQSTAGCMEIYRNMRLLVVETLQQGIDDGSIRHDLEAEKTAVLFIHLVTSFMKRLDTNIPAALETDAYRADELIEYMVSIFLNAIKEKS